MSRFIQLHLLTAYPPANLNRDDQGSPKTAKMGGYDRLRVSSQCLKRTWRTSDLFQAAVGDHLGTRTKLLGLEIYNKLLGGGVKEKDAKEWTKAIAGIFGALKKADKNDPLAELEIEQLVHVSPAERVALDALIAKLVAEQRAPEKDELNLLRVSEQAVDIALFGRMLASSPAFNIEAACQVAHAISVHPVVIEDDYFTAVDDLNNGLDDMGAAHIGETRFAAGLFYAYICINRELLIKNLDGNVDLANRAIRALTEAAVKVAPEGKQNSFASRAYASFVLAEKGDQQPRSLSVAYLKPVGREADDFAVQAIAALKEQSSSFDEVYCACADSRYELNALPSQRQGTLAGLLDFVGQ
ncbi:MULTISPECIES: type I-E CRISPR-associated protein Cas7/Cse4/CasC [Methylomonas]|uniref:Type I-E CRISPR-associated protein Cas7/Cse4/CasC n=2 Tax=Methylomonas TaxID=416 RepID=A0A126T3M5_9GAMM|nr:MULTISPECIES: type I-E CRISPR-associated protein Cas7/Cse4/CasC [Methylomonas]AMK76344.1 type I-E CRISPR-associated protein Cas7/Cse4/CasC [Methylomonas denitrificans]OAI00538.1 type I-E CRISPR-associated protein Cas7/Cse4/CasC [Methylomonas methanica]TCV88368.1 CRISPR system Cascade subunit CasC [Methylomonas methanica]